MEAIALPVMFGDTRYLFLICGLGERGKDQVSVSDELFAKKAKRYMLVMDKRLIGSGLQFWTAISTFSGEYFDDFYDYDNPLYIYDPVTGTSKKLEKR